MHPLFPLHTTAAESMLAFAGRVPEVYESILGDFVFEPFALDCLQRLQGHAPKRVLELAAGTGRLTRHLTEHFPAPVQILATDISTEMMTEGQRQVSSDNLSWQQADIAELPFPDHQFDLVVCQFGFMFLQDKIRGFSEARRVLQPGGRLLFSVWAPMQDNPVWQITNQVLTDAFGPLPPLFHKVGPFSSSYAPTVLQQLRDAGFGDVHVDRVQLTSAIASAAFAARGFIHGLPFKAFILKKNPEQLGNIEARLAQALSAQLGDFPLSSTFTAFIFDLTK